MKKSRVLPSVTKRYRPLHPLYIQGVGWVLRYAVTQFGAVRTVQSPVLVACRDIGKIRKPAKIPPPRHYIQGGRVRPPLRSYAVRVCLGGTAA